MIGLWSEEEACKRSQERCCELFHGSRGLREEILGYMKPAMLTTEAIQNLLEENQALINVIIANQSRGKYDACAVHRQKLQQNLTILATMQDQQPNRSMQQSLPQSRGMGKCMGRNEAILSKPPLVSSFCLPLPPLDVEFLFSFSRCCLPLLCFSFSFISCSTQAFHHQ